VWTCLLHLIAQIIEWTSSDSTTRMQRFKWLILRYIYSTQDNYCTATTKYLTVLIYIAESKKWYLWHRKKNQGKDYLVAGNAKHHHPFILQPKRFKLTRGQKKMSNGQLAFTSIKPTKKHDIFWLPQSSNGKQFWVMSNIPNIHDSFGVNNNKKKRHTASKFKYLY